MNPLHNSPWRNLAAGLGYLLLVIALSTGAFVQAGWSLGDAFYFVISTVFLVGYGEVHPIATPLLYTSTIATIVLGWLGITFVAAALVQFITFTQLQQLLGTKRMKTQIAKMSGHVIVCGYGRIGHMLADELKAGGITFVILDREESKLTEATAHGHVTWAGDATDEAVLEAVGVHRAKALACVVPNDAVNVFITLSARNLNKDIEIIARGEAASTKSKLLRAGASAVVEPTHIGAERIAQLILFPQSAKVTDSGHMHALAAGLRGLGLELEVMAAAADGAMAGTTIEAVERAAGGTMFVVALNRKNGEILRRPNPDTLIESGDGVVAITRSGRSAPPNH
ncbi:TrkA family potassium uptake protein [Acidocella sp.]|uniref:potassium channel family protein n=1 Tax=Acidocella sp. TaxID=50710 RepID=UPI00261302C3|nr:potassium channel family protein [Acidocella sp.]